MKYMGSKNRISKFIVPILEKNRVVNQWYIEPFVGGANMIDKMSGNRAGFDSNEYLIELLNGLKNGWKPPKDIKKEDYLNIKNNINNFDKKLVGYAGLQLNYGSMWFGSFRRDNIGKRNYSLEAYNNVIEQAKNLKNIHFETKNFQDLKLFEPCLIYCDPPYAGTIKYKDDFPYSYFWDWVRNMIKDGHKIFISEYKAPEDFICIWSKDLRNGISKNKATEKLFIHESQFNSFIQ